MNTLRLAGYYLRFHKAKTVILVVCIGLTIYLPLTSHWLVAEFDARMSARAMESGETPLIIGLRGGKFDLVLHALNFKPLPKGSKFGVVEMDNLRKEGYSTAIPIFVNDHAMGKGKEKQKCPIVGTSLDYLEFRGLKFARGGPMTLIGDCVLGADAARLLNSQPGGVVKPEIELGGIVAEQMKVSVKLNVTGVLMKAHTADDRAIFTDLKTAWIVAGEGHGHGADEKHNIMLNPAHRITADNLLDFHFHKPPGKLPLSAIIALPHNEGNATMQLGVDRYLDSEKPLQALVPDAVVGEMIDAVFQAKRFVDASQVAVAVCTGLFLMLVVMLSLRLRREEMETMFQLGCSRATMFWLQATELGIICIASTALALALVWLTLDYVDGLMRGMGI